MFSFTKSIVQIRIEGSRILQMTCGLPGLNTSKEASSPRSPKHTPEPGCVDFYYPDNRYGYVTHHHEQRLVAANQLCESAAQTLAQIQKLLRPKAPVVNIAQTTNCQSDNLVDFSYRSKPVVSNFAGMGVDTYAVDSPTIGTA